MSKFDLMNDAEPDEPKVQPVPEHQVSNTVSTFMIAKPHHIYWDSFLSSTFSVKLNTTINGVRERIGDLNTAAGMAQNWVIESEEWKPSINEIVELESICQDQTNIVQYRIQQIEDYIEDYFKDGSDRNLRRVILSREHE